MCYNYPMADNSEFVKEFLGAYNDPNTNKKSLGKAIGLPDKEDEEFLLKLIGKYEAQNPGWIAYMRDHARKEFEAGKYGSVFNDDATVNKASKMTYDFELPPSLFRQIERHYPLMFKDIDHYRWFKNKFAVWMIKPNVKRKPRIKK